MLNEGFVVPGITTPLARMPPPADKRNDPKSVDTKPSTFKKDAAESKLSKLATSALEEVEADVEQDVEKASPAKEDAVGSKAAENQNTANVVNADELSDNEINSNVVPGISKRLKTRKRKNVDVTPPAKSIKKKTMYGPPKPWSKVVPPSSKRKARPVSSTDDDDDDEDAVKDPRVRRKLF